MKLLTVTLIALLLLSCSGSNSQEFSSGYGTHYALNLGKDFDKGKNAIDDFGISIALAIDVSGSMYSPPASGGAEKYIQAARALSTVASYLETLSAQQPDLKIQVALFKFSTDVDTLLPLTLLDAAGVRRLKTLANPSHFEPQGSTSIGKALEAGARVLAQSGTIFNSLIVVTDGENNGQPEPTDVIDAIYSNRNSATEPDFPITTSTQLISFIGFDIQSPQFQIFHEKGARITSADNQTELELSLKALLEADITKLEAQ